MRFNLNYLYFFIVISLLFSSCSESNQQLIEEVVSLNDSIKTRYAPDKRVAIYDVQISDKNKKVLLTGESDQPAAVEDFKNQLTQKGIEFIDSIHMLPDLSTKEYPFAIVNNSVANIRSKGKHSSELATQALLGMPLNVLKIKGDFYQVQTPDKYIAWVDHGGVQLMNELDFDAWNNSEKVIYTQSSGYVYRSELFESKVSDIVLGAQLKLIEEADEYFKVSYPDNRVGYIKKDEGERYNKWSKNLKPSQELIENYAVDFIGTPYLWGGTSTKGVDCSGFTKTVYLMNGYIIPRDASQQINAGEIVDPELEFDKLEKGDLMFFGTKATAEKKQRVTHVGIWLGNEKGEFIHSSKQVRMSSIDQNSEYYDEGNKNRYLGSRRYLGVNDPMILNLKEIKKASEIKP